jgi:hypothetical protein
LYLNSVHFVSHFSTFLAELLNGLCQVKTATGLSMFPLFAARGGSLDAPGDGETNKRFLKDGVNITPTLFEPLFAEDNQELCKLVLNGEARVRRIAIILVIVV